MEERYALLIDADNVSAKYIKPILDGYMICENGVFEWKNLEGEGYQIWKRDTRC